MPYDDALTLLLNSVRIEPSWEELEIEKAVGRVLAHDIVSEYNIPERNLAVFDGYVLHPEDVEKASKDSSVTLDVIGGRFPGDDVTDISRGHAIFTATGGPVPIGPYALVKVENTRSKNDQIEVCFPMTRGENVALSGEDVEKGEHVFSPGHILRSQDVGLLAGIGIGQVRVFRRPTVAVISVGDELVSFRDKTTNKIVNNYALVVSRLVSEFGGVPRYYGIVKDDLEKIKALLTQAASESDLVVTIAGCSLGPKDLVPDAIESLGQITFHGLKLSPGKVVGAGIISDKPIIMLPGHIVSTFAGFFLFTVPILATYSGLTSRQLLPSQRARLVTDTKKKTLPYFMRLSLKKTATGFEATPVSGGSSRLNTLVKSNGFYIVPAKRVLRAGEEIDVVLYSPLELGHISS